jgi:hypothetical protein
MKWSILITVEESSFYMIKHLNLAQFEYVPALKSEVLDTHF